VTGSHATVRTARENGSFKAALPGRKIRLFNLD
jgi:hypothetical protein